MTRSYQGIEDNSLPLIPKPSLQQYDNFQTYDICCLDDLDNPNIIGDGFLAVQAYSVEPITSNFIDIINTYH